MPEPEVTPAGSPEGNQQQAPGTQKPAGSGIPEGYVPEARLTGALQKINELTLTNRSLNEQLVAVNTRFGELQAQGHSKETEWTAKAGEHANLLKGVTEERDALKQQLAEAQLNQKKLNMIASLGHFNLLAIAEQIPSNADEAKQKEAIEKMAAFAQNIAQSRETQLTAGNTGLTNVQPNAGAAMPTTSKGWEALIESKPLGSPERQKVYDDYFAWTMEHPQGA